MRAQNSKMLSGLYQQKHFSLLKVTFWDTKEKITKNYELLLKILQENDSKPLPERNNYGITIESLKKTYNLLTDPKERESYLSFLKYYYFLSEPISLPQLKKNYHNKIFPYYLFTIKIKEKAKICELIIDFISKKIIINQKDKQLHLIKSEDIITVNKKFGMEILLMLKNEEKKQNEKSKSKSEFKDIIFEPEISQQTEIIYTLISYLAKNIEDDNFYSLLENESYRPCGIILRSKILKSHQSKILGKDNRYAVLGPSMIIIFKNEEMIDVRNILPLCPFLMRVNFIEKEKTIVFIYPSREQSLSFYDSEHYSMWVTALKEIFVKRISSKMDTVEYLQANELKGKDLIIKEIGIEIDCVQEEIKAIKDKLDKFKEKIKNGDEK